MMGIGRSFWIESELCREFHGIGFYFQLNAKTFSVQVSCLLTLYSNFVIFGKMYRMVT